MTYSLPPLRIEQADRPNKAFIVLDVFHGTKRIGSCYVEPGGFRIHRKIIPTLAETVRRMIHAKLAAARRETKELAELAEEMRR